MSVTRAPETQTAEGGGSLAVHGDVVQIEQEIIELRVRLAIKERELLAKKLVRAAGPVMPDEERLSERVRFLYRNVPFQFAPSDVMTALQLGSEHAGAVYKILQRLARNGFLEHGPHGLYALSQWELRRMGIWDWEPLW